MAEAHVRIEREEIEAEVARRAEEVDRDAEAIGLREATEEELLAAMLCTDSVVMARETIEQARKNVAKGIFIDEYHRRIEEGDAYQPPILVPLLNGGAKFAIDVAEELASYAAELPDSDEVFMLDLDPVLINPSLYKDSQTPGTGSFEKGYTQAERERMSGRHVILADDGFDRALTVKFTRSETITQLTGPMAVPVFDQDTGELVDYRVVQLEPPASIRTAVLWVKERAAEDADYTGAHVDNDWINGYGCNTMLSSGDSVGRNTPFIARTAVQPE